MSSEVTMTAIDGRDALLGVIFRPGPDSTVTVEFFGSGVSRDEAVALLQTATDALMASEAYRAEHPDPS